MSSEMHIAVSTLPDDERTKLVRWLTLDVSMIVAIAIIVGAISSHLLIRNV